MLDIEEKDDEELDDISGEELGDEAGNEVGNDLVEDLAKEPSEKHQGDEEEQESPANKYVICVLIDIIVGCILIDMWMGIALWFVLHFACLSFVSL